MQTPPMLRLRMADNFWLRLLGVLAARWTSDDEGLLLTPCRAIHTFFLSQAIDIVFLDSMACECGCVHSLPPYRVAFRMGAHMVVELPAGYCRRHPDYLAHIRLALDNQGYLLH